MAAPTRPLGTPPRSSRRAARRHPPSTALLLDQRPRRPAPSIRSLDRTPVRVGGGRQARRQSLYRLAASQAGYFTAAQALDLGYSYQAQKYHIDHGNWARVDWGIFRIPEWPSSLHESFVRWVLWSKQRAVVSHDSAAVVHNLGLLNPAKVHLTVPSGFRMDDPALVLHRRALPDTNVMLLEGVVVTTVVRTVLDVIDSQFDEQLVASVVVDALDTGAVSERQIRRGFDGLNEDARVRGERVLAWTCETETRAGVRRKVD